MAGLTRRAFGVGMLGAATAAAGNAAAPTQGTQSERERLHTMIRMLGRTDGAIAVRWTRGVLSAIIEQTTTPLLGVSQQIYTRHRMNEDGSFDAVYFEIVYFTDLRTGIAEERWLNPITGRTVTVPRQLLGPTRIHVPLDLKIVNEPFPIEGLINNHWLEPLPSMAGEVIFDERIDSYVPPLTEGGAALRFHEVFTFRTALSNLRSDAPHVPTTVYKLNVISWRPWMDMNDVDGVSLSRAAGQVVAGYEHLPAVLAEMNDRYFPEVVAGLDNIVHL